MSYPQVQLHIDGAWIGKTESGCLPIANPADAAVLGHFPVAGPAELAAARHAARAGFARWSATLEDALSRANALSYGLSAYAFTKDLGTATRLSTALHAGMVGINHFGISQPETPFGGIKDSGMGSESGLEGLLDFTEIKFVSVAA